MILATENINNLDDPVKVLRWIFKVYDFDAKGYIPVTDIESIVQQIIRCLDFSVIVRRSTKEKLSAYSDRGISFIFAVSA